MVKFHKEHDIKSLHMKFEDRIFVMLFCYIIRYYCLKVNVNSRFYFFKLSSIYKHILM